MRSVVAIAAIVLNGLFLLLGACAGTPQEHAVSPEAVPASISPSASFDLHEAQEEDVHVEPAPELPRPPARALSEDRRGEATYFRPGPRGSCGATPDDGLVAAFGPAMNAKHLCGRCAQVTGPKGTITVTINDRCEGCKGASMDLSTRAFTQIAEKTDGRVGITWHLVDCP